MCGRIGHGKSSCQFSNIAIPSTESSQYGPWIRAEMNEFAIVREGHFLRLVEVPRGELDDSLSDEINRDVRVEKDENNNEGKISDESTFVSKKEGESNQASSAVGEPTLDLQGEGKGYMKEPVADQHVAKLYRHVDQM